jgi:hypothetical protein
VHVVKARAGFTAVLFHSVSKITERMKCDMGFYFTS